MAKVMISVPDDLLEQIDARAHARGLSRSGLIQELARSEVGNAEQTRRARIDHWLSQARPHDGRAVEHIRADRDRDDRNG